MVDGSNESLYCPDEESDPILRKGIPLQKSFQKVDVWGISGHVQNDPLRLGPTSFGVDLDLPLRLKVGDL